MKRPIVLAAVFILFVSAGQSQEFAKEFGKVSDEELKMTVYPRDPVAEAVILFDIGESKFIDADQGYEIQFTRTKRIKVISKAGVKFSEISIPLYTGADGRKETLNNLVAVSYNLENGEVRRAAVNPASLFEERLNNRWILRKFVFPDVKPGTVIEYMYSINTPYLFNLPDWEFQARIPTVYSRYTVRMIPFYEYAFIVQGTNKFDVQSSTPDKVNRTFGSMAQAYGQNVGGGVIFQDMIHVYGMNNVPAFRDEAYITSVQDYIVKMDFQLAKVNNPYGTKQEIISTWDKLIEELLRADEFGKYLKGSEKNAEKVLATVPLPQTGEKAVCREIINYVKKSYKWDGFSSLYTSKSPKEFVTQKTGNSTDINLFLAAMLRSAGFDATPVIISTRDHGKISVRYPFLHYFNYVIVKVNTSEGVFLCDGTESSTQFDRIPPRCINERGLIINSEGENWVVLNAGFNSVDEKNLNIEIDPVELKSKITMNLQAIEFDAYWYRKNFENDSTKLKKHLTESGFVNVSKITTFNYGNNEKPYIIACEGEADIEKIDNKLIISPFLSFYLKENKLTQQTRSYPIDLTYSNTESFKCSIKVPQGYKVLSVPEPFNLDTELAKITASYKVEGDVIYIDCSYGFKKAVYPSTDYRNIKMYYDFIIKRFNEQIVLEKSI